MQRLFFLTWLVLTVALWSFEWTRMLMLGLIGLGVLCMAMGLVCSTLAVVWDVARRWLVSSNVGVSHGTTGQTLHPLP